jgi:hypothetical protein
VEGHTIQSKSRRTAGSEARVCVRVQCAGIPTRTWQKVARAFVARGKRSRSWCVTVTLPGLNDFFGVKRETRKRLW